MGRLPGRLAPLTVLATVGNLLERDHAEPIGFPAPRARFLVGRYQLQAGK